MGFCGGYWAPVTGVLCVIDLFPDDPYDQILSIQVVVYLKSGGWCIVVDFPLSNAKKSRSVKMVPARYRQD